MICWINSGKRRQGEAPVLRSRPSGAGPPRAPLAPGAPLLRARLLAPMSCRGKCPRVTGAWTLCRVPGPRRWRPSKARGLGARVLASDYRHLSAIRAPSQVRAPKASSRRGKGIQGGGAGKSWDAGGWRPPQREPRRLTRVRSGRGTRGSFAASGSGSGRALPRSRTASGLRRARPRSASCIFHQGGPCRAQAPRLLVPVLDGASAPRPLLPRLSSARSEQLGYFSGRRRGPSLAPPPEPVRGGCAFHLLRGCQPVTLPLLRPVLGVLAAGRGGPPLCVSGSGPCTARQFLSRTPLGSAVEVPLQP